MGGDGRDIVDGIAEFYNETDEMIRQVVTRVDCDLVEDRPFLSILPV